MLVRKRSSKAFVCFIGIDGAGKTTHARELRKQLLTKGVKSRYMTSRYALVEHVPLSLRKWITHCTSLSSITLPSKTSNTIKSNAGSSVLRFILFFLFLAYALATYLLVIKPLLNDFVVICDRYFFEWFYNSFKKSSVILIRLLPKPDLVFFLDIPEVLAFSRIRHFEDKKVPLGYYRALREWYRFVAKQQGFITVNSSLDFDKTRKLLLNHVVSFIETGDKYVQ